MSSSIAQNPLVSNLLVLKMTFESTNLFLIPTQIKSVGFLSRCSLSKHVSPRCGRTKRQIARTMKSDQERNVLKGGAATPCLRS
jgi:hypothetical protein